MEHVRPLVAVSSCLLGAPVRYNGGHSRDRFLAEELDRYVDWRPVCPEIEIGLGAPRPTLRLVTDSGEVRLVTREGDADHTEAMRALADRRAEELAGVDGWVLKARSPSCGLRGIPRYRKGQPADRRGRGVFAERLTERLPLLPVEEEGRLHDDVLRAHFVERIFARARLRALLAGDWRPRDLVAFHTRHKLQLLAHDPDRYRRLGRVVAEAGSAPRTRVEAGYAELFAAALAVRPRRGRHVNALLHVFGPMSERLDDARRHDIVTAIEEYRQGTVPLGVPMALLRHHARGEGCAYLLAQTYFEPYPRGLVPSVTMA
ncbi:Uncharacterized conserved protein YbgA, DUF1722 family [Thermomonospora echinospora]|uniref:Uncharacterized conserved protein YbgA, DUF1722 family n=1 Tax=Thermomonospora echinospora TaxID=1992 RepID=A0A1H6A1E8_9ACTN|nr:DUF523 and DUF1722 domain-containing protein [Thermomonospora echinospora]SEG42172.1 Uncharacterized conserved protein YbgA, DUF1722 family [Thermomonospora echinospora]